MLSLRKCRIGVVGLGYVGLPLAVEFGKHFETIGFDVNPQRVAQLRKGRDSTLEVSPEELRAAQQLTFTTDLEGLRRSMATSGRISPRWNGPARVSVRCSARTRW